MALDRGDATWSFSTGNAAGSLLIALPPGTYGVLAPHGPGSHATMPSGDTSAERLEVVAGSAAIVATRVGRGVAIRMVDNPNCRGIWYGTNKLFLDSPFLGHLIDETELYPKPD